MASANRARVSLQLVNGSTERILWLKTYERDLKDFMALEQVIAQEAASEIHARLSSQLAPQ